MHLCIFLSPVDTSLGWSALFGPVLASAALLGIGRKGGFYSHIVYTCPLERLVSAHWFFLFLQDLFQTPFIFGEKLEDSALSLRVLLLVLAVKSNPEEALKLSELVLIVLSTFSEKGLRRFRRTFWVSPQNMAL